MSTSRKIAIVVGVLFIIGTASGIAGKLLAAPILHAPDYLVHASANENQVIIGALLVFVMGAAIALIPTVLFPVLKRHNESLALAYAVLRTLEVVTFLVAIPCWLLLLTLSEEYATAGAPDTPYFQAFGTLIQGAEGWNDRIMVIVFSLNALILNYILYRSRLIPRWISGWGLVGAALHLVEGSLGMMFGSIGVVSVLETLAFPGIALQEMVYAVWLIVKGFNTSRGKR